VNWTPDALATRLGPSHLACALVEIGDIHAVPYPAIDQACYAFQVADYAEHHTCISVDVREAGRTSTATRSCTTELFADDVAAFMQAVGVQNAQVSGLSLGAATGMWPAAKYPEIVKTLSLHSAWAKTDPFLSTVVEGCARWRRGWEA
jgi:pimeloyl-ACP methyl ester carboxylesterase